MSFLVLLITVVLGCVIGSFLNVLIDRLPKGETVVRGRSHCDHCQHILSWYELIPIFSYLLQGGRCRKCHNKLSLQYPLIEMVAGLGFGLLYVYLGGAQIFESAVGILRYIASAAVFCSLLVVTVSDIKYFIVPDAMVITGLIGAMLNLLTVNPVWPALVPAVLSALGAGLFFLALFLITKGKGMGFGDVKLVFVIGLVTGFPGIVLALYTAFLTGAAASVILIIGGKKTLKSIVPFGPFLIIGAVASILWHQAFITWWKGFIW